MILGKDTNPKKQIYYISALVINELKETNNPEFDFFDIFNSLKLKNNDITINLYSLALDWLYLLGAIKNDKNRIIKCF